MATHGIWNCGGSFVHERPFDWNGRTVADILARPEYLGHTVNGRSSVESYKTHKRVFHDPAQWQIIENTHEAIIDQETFDLVQKTRKVVRRTDTIGKPNPLTGLVFCADCGRKMYNHRRNSEAKRRNLSADPSTKMNALDSYICSTYNLTKYYSEKVCSSHWIPSRALRALILDAIRSTAQFALFDRERFIQRVREESQVQTQAQAKELQKRIAKAQRRVSELDRLIMKVYEDYALERIPLERYQQMAAVYEAEQKTLKEALAADQANADAFTEDTDRADRFLALAQRYTDFSVLTDEMILAFVDRILVHESQKIDGERTQEVEIYLNHIGKIELSEEMAPSQPPVKKKQTPEERKRAYFHNYYLTKVKPRREAQKAAAQ